MKIVTQLLAFLLSFLAFQAATRAQIIDTIVGCDEIPSLGQVEDCILCDFGLLYGNTSNYSPSPEANWCGTIENDQYIGFVVGPTGDVLFEVLPFNCSNGQGIQAAIYDQNNNLVGDCLNQVMMGQPGLVSASGLTPQEIYFLRIDGFAGDLCDFSIQAIFGVVNSRVGIFQVELNGSQSVIQYSPSLCETNSAGPDTSIVIDGCVYNASYRLEPDSLPYQVQTNNSRDSFQIITWPAPMEQRVLLVQELELTSNNNSGTCPDSLILPYYSHFLDLTDNTLLSDKAWACDSERLVGTIEGQTGSVGAFSSSLHVLESGPQRYVLSGAGYHGLAGEFEEPFMEYRVIQDQRAILTGAFSENDFQDTLLINNDDGPVIIQFSNLRPWFMEAAIERLDSVTPWTILDATSHIQYNFCVSQVVSLSQRISPNYAEITNANLNFQFELLSSELTDRNQIVYPTQEVLQSSVGNPFLRFENIALPGQLPPGNYTYTATVRPLDDLSPICGINDDFDVTLSFKITPPLNNFVLPNLTLSPQRDSVTLFTNLPSAFQLTTNVPGTYYAYRSCSVYEQTLLPSLLEVDLGTFSLCPGDCVVVPTGEIASCTPGIFSFFASNDTTYNGSIVVDSSAQITLEAFEYRCDSTTGEWFMDLAWSGSRSPYTLNGQIRTDTFGTAGPFQDGDDVEIALFGSSICIDTLFIPGSFSCLSSTSTVQSLGIEIRQLGSSLIQVNAPSYGWRLTLIDVLGREVYTTPLQRDANQIAVADILPGTYFIVVQKGSQLATEKWVKR